MININFVPDDYIQKRESLRANMMYLILFLIVMISLSGTFVVLKISQKAIANQAMIAAAKMDKAKKDIAQLEDLQAKHKLMMKAALMTAELIEPAPRTVILAELTNTLPAGVSLGDLKLLEKQPSTTTNSSAPKANTYDQAKTAAAAQNAAPAALPEKNDVETCIEIDGIAPSDIQVAEYIAQLNNSILLDDVQLVLSKESVKDDIVFREFKLTARLKKDIHLSKEDIDRIRAKKQSML
jgi:Tfp pilus assembly protein PilN